MSVKTPLKIVSGQIQQFASGDSMSTVKPLVISSTGQIEQLQSGDSISQTVSATFDTSQTEKQSSPSSSFTINVA